MNMSDFIGKIVTWKSAALRYDSNTPEVAPVQRKGCVLCLSPSGDPVVELSCHIDDNCPIEEDGRLLVLSFGKWELL